MGERTGKIYEFDEFRLDPDERTLTHGDEAVALTPKVFDLLVLFAENPGRLLEKEWIIGQLWQDSFVEEANLNVNVSTLRRALGETPNEARFVETIPRRGYRFVAEVTESGTAESTPHQDPVTDPRARKFPRWLIALSVAVIILGTGAAMLYFRNSAANSNTLSVHTIAVLPFKPLVKDQGDDALEMGMADALITKLGSLEQLTVRPTGAISKYRNSEADPLTVGRELQVDAVLDGKIQRADNKVRVTVQLLRVADGSTIWAGSFDDFFSNIFAVQDSISERMLSSMSLKLTGKEKTLLAKRSTENTEAYALYLQARYFHEQISEEGSRKALVFYRAALQNDPDYALVYASMTGALIHLANLNIEREVNLQTARDSAAKAVELDPNLAEAYEARATIKEALDWDFVGAETDFKRAVELDPRSPDAHYSYSILLSILGRHDAAIAAIETARSLDPTAGYIQAEVARTYVFAHRFEDALREIRKAVEMEPNSYASRTILFRIQLYRNAPAEARKELDGWPGFNEPGRKILEAEIDLETNQRARGVKFIREYLAGRVKGITPNAAAMYYAKIGDLDGAFAALDDGIKRRDPLIMLVASGPEFDAVRSDPRFVELKRRMNLPDTTPGT
jgi:DNA-binding winged helix-turn-helix (wHTH) protein/TolB-like protein/Tfp pilus assembly protein PilF